MGAGQINRGNEEELHSLQIINNWSSDPCHCFKRYKFNCGSSLPLIWFRPPASVTAFKSPEDASPVLRTITKQNRLSIYVQGFPTVKDGVNVVDGQFILSRFK